jgi:hypothetical protein
MKHNSSFEMFASAKGAVIAMRILSEMQPLDATTFREEMRQYGVGGSAFNSSIRVCYELGLVEVKPERYHQRGQATLNHVLTKKGRQIAEYVKAIDALLE